MENILANYDEERIREFTDDGEEALRDMQPQRDAIYCADCDDAPVEVKGFVCPVCLEVRRRTTALQSHLYTEVMTVCAQVLSPDNQNLKQWDVVACVRDLAQMAMAAKS